MCRPMTKNATVDLPFSYPRDRDRDRDRLKIKSFHLRLSLVGTAAHRRRLPEALTLVYLPRITGNPLEINGAKVPPDALGLVTLHRTRTAEPAGGGEAAFASTDRVGAAGGEGAARFEVYIGAELALKGGFRRGSSGWAMECRCTAAEGEVGVSAAEVCVVAERGVVMREEVKMRRRKGGLGFCLKLDEIPEEGEMDGCDCCGCEEEGWEVVGSDGVEWSDGEMDGGDDEVVGEMEGVRWAVDVGIWVVCLGVGLLVSSKRWRRRI